MMDRRAKGKGVCLASNFLIPMKLKLPSSYFSTVTFTGLAQVSSSLKKCFGLSTSISASIKMIPVLFGAWLKAINSDLLRG